MKKWEDRKLWEDGKYLVFHFVCLVERVENFFVWFERKREL